MNTTTTPPKLYRISAVMAQLGVSRATIYRMVAAGKLRLVKIGERSSGITAESIDQLIDSSPSK
ncbi:helix-turn-helix domain-containing protein [Caballeronia sp. EK]|uniref:helix-turn-helix transcriptional regulator n=1 Tax=Caballeronia sp. EK TaxID=2767469 RepID=UPI001655A149|nr:excisionase family DNA-binding protein [Caballeronia sp. EK]MBC8642096.1 helix-turn-helix domain-containing protein [Caballeronia sp. EK]